MLPARGKLDGETSLDSMARLSTDIVLPGFPQRDVLGPEVVVGIVSQLQGDGANADSDPLVNHGEVKGARRRLTSKTSVRLPVGAGLSSSSVASVGDQGEAVEKDAQETVQQHTGSAMSGHTSIQDEGQAYASVEDVLRRHPAWQGLM